MSKRRCGGPLADPEIFEFKIQKYQLNSKLPILVFKSRRVVGGRLRKANICGGTIALISPPPHPRKSAHADNPLKLRLSTICSKISVGLGFQDSTISNFIFNDFIRGGQKFLEVEVWGRATAKRGFDPPTPPANHTLCTINKRYAYVDADYNLHPHTHT